MPQKDTDFIGAENNDIPERTKYLSKMLVAPPSSPRTPDKKCKFSKRSLEKSPSPSPISKLNPESLGHLDGSFDFAEKKTEVRDIPSPPKRQRITQAVTQAVVGGETNNKFDKTEVKPKIRENPLSRRERRILEKRRRLQLAIRGKEKVDDIVAAPLRGLAGETCCGNNPAVEDRGIKHDNGKVEETQVSLNIEQMKSDSGIGINPTTLEMDSFFGNEERVEGSKIPSPRPEHDELIAREKKDSGIYLKFLELLYGETEQGAKKEMEELALVIESVKRMFMSGKLERKLQKIDDRKTRDKMYLKALESLNDDTGTESNNINEDLGLIIEIFKFVRSGQLAKDLQILREIFEVCQKGLDRLIKEAEAAYASKTQEEQLISPISSKVSTSSEIDYQVDVLLAKEHGAITTNNIQDKNLGGAEFIGKISEKVWKEPWKEPISAATKPRWREDFPLPADFDEEAVMLQQAFIQSNYDEFVRSKSCRAASCSTAYGNDVIDKKPNTTIIGGFEKAKEENIEDISLEDQQDADDENSDTSESKSAHCNAYSSDEESELDTKKTSEMGKLTENKDFSDVSIECTMKDLVIATVEQLKQDFLSMFYKKRCESTGNESDNLMDEKFIATTAAVVRRTFKFLNLDAFSEALKKAAEEVLVEGKEKERCCVTSSEHTASIEQEIFKKWTIAYPEGIPMHSFEFARAIHILTSLTRSPPYNHAILEDTPECKYDALVVYIQYYLDTCTEKTCTEIVEGHPLDQQLQSIREMHSFVYWWKEVSEELEGLWGKRVLNKDALQNYDEYGSSWSK
ncbi:hypothetical protein BOTCAL_0029g00440 [Botryotinia calthae]|uniref:Uncharacterized protein n=1 Tax=Botryotinia calthae TaxID=38488 RepID=A0A4Y8DDV0_9HELO|nr:hypothetical protein BOTCAL_0029g00440 [Botryotinia calthae]